MVLSITREKSCLKFSRVPENSEKENTDDIILNVVNKVVLSATGKAFDPAPIGKSHRLGAPRSKGALPKDIIVQFIRYRYCAMVFGNKDLFINEALTKSRSEIFSWPRIRKHNGLTYPCGSFEGHLYIINPKAIKKKSAWMTNQILLKLTSGNQWFRRLRCIGRLKRSAIYWTICSTMSWSNYQFIFTLFVFKYIIVNMSFFLVYMFYLLLVQLLFVHTAIQNCIVLWIIQMLYSF